MVNPPANYVNGSANGLGAFWILAVLGRTAKDRFRRKNTKLFAKTERAIVWQVEDSAPAEQREPLLHRDAPSVGHPMALVLASSGRVSAE